MIKTAIPGIAALLIGVGGGAFMSGSKVRDEIMQAHADSVALAEASGDHTDSEGGASIDHAAGSSEGAVEIPVGAGPPQGATEDGGHEASDGAAAQDDEAGATTNVDVAPQSDSSARLPAVVPLVGPAGVGGSPASADASMAASREAAKKLSKIFGAMKAPDAAAVLQEMTDQEVQTILLQMGDRLAAAILGEFEPARAATLTRAVLSSRGNDS